ncbi:MAG: D-alanyl-D-alanine carboxypeptidase family protein [Lysobacteraceae bacterium]
MSFRTLLLRPLLAGLIAAASPSALAQSATDLPQPNLPTPTPAQMPIPPAPAAAGTAWLLMDHASGRILAGHNIDQPLHPASLTKIMTAYVLAAEMSAGRVTADDEVLISENAWRSGGAGTDGSFSALAVGSRVKLSDIEMGLVVQSGNDAAIAIAEHLAGSEEAFAGLMNSYAQKLGLSNSHFVNAHGLTAEGHLMSARDIATLSRALIRDYPEHYALSKVKEYTYSGIRQYNRNGLLWKDDSVDGIKTGHTSAAGYCLAASAERGGQRLISVVMGVEGSRNEGFRRREEGNLALLNWGFRHFETHTLYAANAELSAPRLWKGEIGNLPLGVATPVIATIPRGRYGELVASMDLPPQLAAPVAKGQQVGRLRVKLGDETVVDEPLIALAEGAEAGFLKRSWDGLLMWWESD